LTTSNSNVLVGRGGGGGTTGKVWLQVEARRGGEKRLRRGGVEHGRVVTGIGNSRFRNGKRKRKGRNQKSKKDQKRNGGGNRKKNPAIEWDRCITVTEERERKKKRRGTA